MVRPAELDRPSADATPRRHLEPASWAVLVVSLIYLGLSATFVWTRLATPFDGGRLMPGERSDLVWRPNGVVVTPFVERPGGLKAGDLVIAVDGRSMVSWAGDLPRPWSASPDWQTGVPVSHTVIRDGRELDLDVLLSAIPPIG